MCGSNWGYRERDNDVDNNDYAYTDNEINNESAESGMILSPDSIPFKVSGYWVSENLLGVRELNAMEWENILSQNWLKMVQNSPKLLPRVIFRAPVLVQNDIFVNFYFCSQKYIYIKSTFK